MKDLHCKLQDITKKNSKKMQINGKTYHTHGLEELILLKYPSTQSDLQIPIKILMTFFFQK